MVKGQSLEKNGQQSGTVKVNPSRSTKEDDPKDIRDRYKRVKEEKDSDYKPNNPVQKYKNAKSQITVNPP